MKVDRNTKEKSFKKDNYFIKEGYEIFDNSKSANT